MGNQVKSVHKTAIVQHAILHVVGIGTVVIATKRQGHAPIQLLRASRVHLWKTRPQVTHDKSNSR